MVKAIEESLYRWQKEGWIAETIDNGQYTLTHAQARPVICGLRTSFQTVGAVQGEMQRALRDGPNKAEVTPPPVPPTMARRVKAKKKATLSNGFSFDEDRRLVRHPLSPYRKRPAQVVEQPSQPVRLEPFHNAAWELAYLSLRARQIDPSVIAIFERRYETDATYRDRLMRSFLKTPQDAIQALREKVKQLE